jgi:hypothetical protein
MKALIRECKTELAELALLTWWNPPQSARSVSIEASFLIDRSTRSFTTC